jgi:pimeloyl-ACP methyl ester carboxylesterase
MAIPDRRVVFTLVTWTACVVGACATAGEESLDPDPATSTVVSADGSPISYDVAGDGPTALVFVHGWSCDRTYLDAQVAEFADDHRVVTLDPAGHGTSGMERRDYSILSFGADVAAVAETLDLRSIILIGHSMGGDVIVEAAKLLPGRVHGLIWVDTYKTLPINRSEAELEAMIAPYRQDFQGTAQRSVRGMFPEGSDPVLVSRVAGDISSAPPVVALSALESALRYAHEIPAALEILGLPTFAINPDTPPTDEESLRRHGVEPVLVPGVGHFPMMENPSRFNTVLRQVLQRVRTDRPNPWVPGNGATESKELYSAVRAFLR